MHYDLRSLGVLMAEQNNHLRHVLRGILREFGVRNVRDTRNAERAFNMFIEESADLILTDWTPRLDGMDLLDKVRNSKNTPDPYVPVIVVTANSELRHVVRARDMGMTEFLAKPISAKLIYSRIRSVIESKRLFVRNRTFFGPDRRRRRIGFDGPDRRHHQNRAPDRRGSNTAPFTGPERRQGLDGFHAPEQRTTSRHTNGP